MENRLKIFNYDDDKFKEKVTESKSYRNLVRLIFNDELLDDSTIAYISITHKNDLLKKIKKLELDISHFQKEYRPWNKVNLKKVLVENNNKEYNSNNLKKILYREQIKEEKCEACGLEPIYNGFPLALQLDHINGNNKDNRIENLRILCPTCHYQTSTSYSGHKKKNWAWELRMIVFNCEENIFKEVVSKSKSYPEIIRLLLGCNKTRYLSQFYKRDILNKINELELDISHFNKEKTNRNKIDLKKILVLNPTIKMPGWIIKHHLFNDKIKEEKCETCGLGKIWNGLPSIHQMDHINGNNKDNRLENLRILCPNCHSQTNTFSKGQVFKNKTSIKPSKEILLQNINELKDVGLISKKYNITEETIRSWLKTEGLYEIYLKISKSSREPKKEYNCSKCNKEISRKNKTNICRYCKSNCPSKEQLLEDIKQLKSRVAIGKKYGVSDNSVKKWCKKYDLPN
tara:strand:+ start:1138 stop:2511 length:1374 start_codon:yes stop_codon:yes gene_type:complete